MVSKSDSCCQPVACPPVPVCCGESVVAADASPVVVSPETSEAGSVVNETPTLAPEPVVASGPLESATDPIPDLQPVVGDSVKRASNDEPVTEPALLPETTEEPEMVEEERTAEPPVVPDDEAISPVAEDSSVLVDSEDEPVAPMPDVVDEEPPMEDEPDVIVDPTPVTPPEPEPTPEPQPEPEEPNLFDDADGDTAAGISEKRSEESEPNLFDDDMEPADTSPFDSTPSDASPRPPIDSESSDLFGDEPDLSDEVVPLDEPVASDDAVMVDEPADESPESDLFDSSESEPSTAPGTDPFESDESEPAPAADADDISPPAPAADDDDFVTAVEPKRRWIHSSGATSLVATLVDVAGDGSCILDAEGLRLRVPLDNLSGHDRDYVRQVGERLAAARDPKDRPVKAVTTTPPANDTAGL